MPATLLACPDPRVTTALSSDLLLTRGLPWCWTRWSACSESQGLSLAAPLPWGEAASCDPAAALPQSLRVSRAILTLSKGKLQALDFSAVGALRASLSRGPVGPSLLGKRQSCGSKLETQLD